MGGAHRSSIPWDTDIKFQTFSPDQLCLAWSPINRTGFWLMFLKEPWVLWFIWMLCWSLLLGLLIQTFRVLQLSMQYSGTPCKCLYTSGMLILSSLFAENPAWNPDLHASVMMAPFFFVLWIMFVTLGTFIGKNIPTSLMKIVSLWKAIWPIFGSLGLRTDWIDLVCLNENKNLEAAS